MIGWLHIVCTNNDDIAGRTQARRLNIVRRHLDTAAKRAPVEAELRDRPEVSNRATAQDLVVHHTTVSTMRDRRETTGEIGQLEVRPYVGLCQ